MRAALINRLRDTRALHRVGPVAASTAPGGFRAPTLNTMNTTAELETLASSIIGDGKLPNIYFVTVAGKVRYIATNFDEARELWRELPRNIETALEDRLFGVIASTEPRDDEDTRLVTYDNSSTFAKYYPKEATSNTNL